MYHFLQSIHSIKCMINDLFKNNREFIFTMPIKQAAGKKLGNLFITDHLKGSNWR